MNFLLWVADIVCGAGIAYAITFSGATLALGRAVSSTNSKTGYQDAVTPPWSANFSILASAAGLAVIAISWWAFGTIRGCLAVFVLLASVLVFRRVVPGEGSFHYKSLIIRSMASRYADFVRNNDVARAAAMKDLLDKTGLRMDDESPSRTA